MPEAGFVLAKEGPGEWQLCISGEGVGGSAGTTGGVGGLFGGSVADAEEGGVEAVGWTAAASRHLRGWKEAMFQWRPFLHPWPLILMCFISFIVFIFRSIMEAG